MNWELSEVLLAVKQTAFQSVHSFDRLLLYNSLAQNAALRPFQEFCQQEGNFFSEKSATWNCFQLFRSELLSQKINGGKSIKTEFYQLRRRLIENIEALLRARPEPQISAKFAFYN